MQYEKCGTVTETSSPGMKRIAGYRKLSLIDWDGLVSCVIFLSGCQWACPWCHNPSLLKKTDGIPQADLFDFLDNKKKWIDGVVLTGGEPLYREDAIELLAALKARGFKTKLDTNGYRPDLLREALGRGLADYVAIDIKSALKTERYSRATGCEGSLDPVLESIGVLSGADAGCEFRTTIVPGIVDFEDILYNADILPPGALCALQRYRAGGALDPDMRFLPPVNPATVEKMASVLREAGFKVKIRN